MSDPRHTAPRTAKRTLESSPISLSPRHILPMRPYAPRQDSTADVAEPPPPPAKRGRKPGPLSRTAREAQRRLNHSIIEKARRTKINDALASLKLLVPANYRKATEPVTEREQHSEDDNSDNDDDYEEGGSKLSKKPSGAKGKVKKEEKEKEFKLEILIRTVTFLQDLLQRVAVLEASAATDPVSMTVSDSPPLSNPSSQTKICPACKAPLDVSRRQQSKKRKRPYVERESDGYSSGDDAVDDDEIFHSSSIHPRRPKVSRHTGPTRTAIASPSLDTFHRNDAQPLAEAAAENERLPPISSWLDCVMNPQLPTPPCHSRNARSGSPAQGYPSPPASTRFSPENGGHAPPPFLSLGPVATAHTGGSSAPGGARTPEDENAATLLLQISRSPPIRAVRSDSFSSAASASASSPSAGAPATPQGAGWGPRGAKGGWALPEPSGFSLQSGSGAQGNVSGRARALAHLHDARIETPSSLLGLDPVGLARGPLLR